MSSPSIRIAENSLTRWYIDTRPLTSTSSALPLLETLRPPDQETVKRFYHLEDRHMSLASYLLKYFFIHRACHVPWNEITISRTPEPHRRPCFTPPAGAQQDGTAIPNVEFNISHQASLVALAGCIVPSFCAAVSSASSAGPGLNSPDALSASSLPPQAAAFTRPDLSSAPLPGVPQVGIDITCVDESRRRRKSPPATPKALAEFVDTFESVFSQRELDTIKAVPEWNRKGDVETASLHPATTRSGSSSLEEAIISRVRLFYAYWALKEAYIKMTGEALLAPWLQQLEFTDVVAPEPVSSTIQSQPLMGVDDVVSDTGSAWGEPYTGVQTWLNRRRVEDVRIEIAAFERDYLIATAARGAGMGAGSQTTGGVDSWRKLERIDIDKDIAPCALGQCGCLNT
jgi:4'-phosphopantetheinyl transferase